MGDHADDAMEEEERWQELWWDHKSGRCKRSDYCPFCDPDFIPLFKHQAPEE
jgi:hypothetical protein